MPAASSKANYKTYEAQARMVRAIVAAHPEVKWNYKGTQYFSLRLPHRGTAAPSSHPLTHPIYHDCISTIWEALPMLFSYVIYWGEG